MHELSLHILDLIENSIRAGASVVSVTIGEDPGRDELRISVEDNGCGITSSLDEVTSPFYTTKQGKRTGLGLSLLRASAEQAGGHLTIRRSELGGAAIEAAMRLSHVDRAPMGDLATTLSSVVCTNPELELNCRFCVGDRECIIRVSDVVKETSVGQCRGLAVARRVHEKVNAALASLEVAV
jgi:hypothetical protein